MRVCRIFPIFLGLAIHNSGSAVSHEGRTAAERYQNAREQLGRVSVEETLQSLKGVLVLDENHVPALVESAKLYLSLNSPLARSSAEKMLRRAIQLDPDNAQHRVLLGEVMWAQGFLRNAKRQYEEILTQEPNNARAAFGLGTCFMKDFMKYWNMIATEGSSNVVLEWRHFAKEYRSQAIRYLGQSIRHDPALKDAYYHLGLVYMEDMKSNPLAAGRSLVKVANALLKAYPGDKDALLFVGLGYHTSGYSERAWDFFEKALERMVVEERSIIESLDAVAADEERLSVTKAESQAPEAGGKWVDSSERERFWRKLDPLLLTERNERRMEHYRRVAYANLRFSKPRRGIAGWRTEMGRVYIKFGEPLGRTVMRPEVDPRGRLVQAHTELWAYEDFSFQFRNWNGLDAWRFAEGTPSIPYGEWVFKRTAQRYADPFRHLKYSLPYQVAAFRDAGKIRLEVAYAIAKARLKVYGAGAVDLQDGLFLFDSDWKEVSRAVYATQRLADVGADSVRGRYLLSRSTLNVEQGDYHLVAEVQDRRTRSIGTFRETYSFTAQDTSPAISDLLLATSIEMVDPFPTRRQDLKLVLNPLHTFYRTESIYIYFEIYGLTQDDFGRTNYEITYQIGRPEDSEVAPEKFESIGLSTPPGNVSLILGTVGSDAKDEIRVEYTPAERNKVYEAFGKYDPDKRETSVSVRYEGHQENDFTYLEIDLQEIPAGVHALTVELKDLKSDGQGDHRQALFRVVE